MALGQRQYSEDDRSAALAALDYHKGDVSKAAKYLKIPRTTLQSWKNGGATNPDVTASRQIKKGELAERLRDLAHLLLDNIGGKIEEAPLSAVLVGIGIAVDKVQLLEGKPTAINQNEDVSKLSDAELYAAGARILAGTLPPQPSDTVSE